jgi:hypothetical protein
MDQIEGHHGVPGTFQQMFKFDRLLGTDAPALAASRAAGHVVLQGAALALVLVPQGRSRTILHTGQTSIALIIDAKIGHNGPRG